MVCEIKTKPCEHGRLLWEHFCTTHETLWVSYEGKPEYCPEKGNKNISSWKKCK
jgi:hypothetical protein